MCTRDYEESPQQQKLRQERGKLKGRIGSGKYTGDDLKALQWRLVEVRRELRVLVEQPVAVEQV